ncbi:MAG TPA: TetR/AcrR family transcriptional regulator [Acidimicrobiales bacterium]|nr:TetR/AcrR family transcriptional regulator [Acidimicrobiales bacterium]
MGEAQAEAPAQPPARRLAPGERRALLIGAAEETFASRGYTQAGLAEVASLAGVSKTLLYHYFPDGRPELYREVMDRLVAQVVDAVRTAARMPTSPQRRLADLVAALVDYFEQHPDAYRLLILEPWGSGDPSVVGQAMAVRARLASELNGLLAASGQPVPVTMAGGAAAMGAVLHVCELAMAGQVTAEQAVDLAQRFVAGGLGALDLI